VLQKATDGRQLVEVLRVMMNQTVPYCINCAEMWRNSSDDDCEDCVLLDVTPCGGVDIY
jgi:hypothetical protein